MTAPAQTLEERLRDIAGWMESQRWCSMTPAEWETVAEAAAEITRLKAALSEEREKAIEEAANVADAHAVTYRTPTTSPRATDTQAFMDAACQAVANAIRSPSRMKAGE